MAKVSNMVSGIRREDLLPYKIKDIKFDKNSLYFKFPYDFNTENIKMCFNSAFNSIRNIEYAEKLKFRLILCS